MPFNILSLSGGGYRGLFTIEVLSRLEQKAGKPIGQCFDLIAGTSIGGIIAIGLAMDKTAKEIREIFLEKGPKIFPKGEPASGWLSRKVDQFRLFTGGPKYDGTVLRATIEKIVGKDTLLGEAQTRLVIPAVNMTKGSVQIFKTPHSSGVVVDLHRKAVDVAMATSAAPTFFPMAKIDSSYYADGGLVANSPDACALHEAAHFCDQDISDVTLLSIGTTTTGFSLPTSLGPDLGIMQWMKNQRLMSTVMSSQQQIVDFMVGHQLRGRYMRIDAQPSNEQIVDLGLDLATPARRDTLLGLAEGEYQKVAGSPFIQRVLTHKRAKTDFPSMFDK
ncbi:MAG: patatin [Mesorhizobium sp.]|uniref:CBASS cGAMP-activated phospholipase n=1 Tax=Mesorhizobium sp. TaxID=1871066 RepID=UPI000FE7BF11|nr:CBASS cGAMP-activated phospholipase [Mesorhizobium sp.]RWP01396.1 MAG: patatin [Mesorhizobium sp.]TIM43812.1 MAG: patatin [Mesorhizobium sp.]